VIFRPGATVFPTSPAAADSGRYAFANVPNGSVITIDNNLKASYEGGDGNDLTFTVMP
jgi:hypothetical protein